MSATREQALQLDAVDYKNGTKNNWRRQAWNLIRQQTPNPRDAIVLYLPGAQNLDRPVALERGFRAANLIAVEREAKVAAHLRQCRQSVIEGDLREIISEWPPERPVAVVVADLVSGFNGSAFHMFSSWLRNAAFRDGVLLLNMMRGRECGELSHNALTLGRHLGDTCARAKNSLPTLLTARERIARLIDCPEARDLWRDNEASIKSAESFASLANSHAASERHRLWALLGAFIWNCTNEGERVGLHTLERMRSIATWHALPSYQSGRIVFDSVLFKLHINGDWSARTPRPQVRRRIAAALAVRTMRLRGDFS